VADWEKTRMSNPSGSPNTHGLFDGLSAIKCDRLICWNRIDKPTTVDDLAVQLDVTKGQLQIWLKQAVSEKKIKKLPKPVRYQKKGTLT
jgi:hypothetical protein